MARNIMSDRKERERERVCVCVCVYVESERDGGWRGDRWRERRHERETGMVTDYVTPDRDRKYRKCGPEPVLTSGHNCSVAVAVIVAASLSLPPCYHCRSGLHCCHLRLASWQGLASCVGLMLRRDFAWRRGVVGPARHVVMAPQGGVVTGFARRDRAGVGQAPVWLRVDEVATGLRAVRT
ncbi:hypothetical protein EDB89DRAFT_1601678 [Lactarius sanguifluus]|nr:hypothetical protein EDB89DRAFT_1601678 [Lactarius sanguifluus]